MSENGLILGCFDSLCCLPVGGLENLRKLLVHSFFCHIMLSIFCAALEYSVHSTSSDFCFFALAVLVCFVTMELLVVRSNTF